LKTTLQDLDAQYGTEGSRVDYLAVAPEHFGPIVQNLSEAGLVGCPESTRVVIEKPFGQDLTTARQLNQAITRVFQEEQIYRIDHFLGKEMLQNIMVIRFANALFEPLWNNKYIDHIQITSSETVGVEYRGPYYESAGGAYRQENDHAKRRCDYRIRPAFLCTE
jgi:glucose-6-phosphate 1-dehydrogenase